LLAGNALPMFTAGGHLTLLAWAKEYGGEGVHQLKLLDKTVLHITDPPLAKVGWCRTPG
jgi:hypothetical protein